MQDAFVARFSGDDLAGARRYGAAGGLTSAMTLTAAGAVVFAGGTYQGSVTLPSSQVLTCPAGVCGYVAKFAPP